MDEELRALEQRWRASPDDVAVALRYGHALARGGERGAAARVLAAAVDRAPGSEDALRALDSVAPGGLDPEAPWPCPTGDLRNTRRGPVRGPSKLALLRRTPLRYELDLRYDLVVASDGWIVATNARGTEPAPVPGRAPPQVDFGAALDAFFTRTEAPPEGRLVRVALDGAVELDPRDLGGGVPWLLAGRTVLSGIERRAGGSPTLVVLGTAGSPTSLVVGRWGLGPGHAITFERRPDGGTSLVAYPLATASSPRWQSAAPGVALGSPVMRGLEVWVHGVDAIAAFDLVTGALRGSVPLGSDRLPRGGDLVAGRDCTVFFARPMGIGAISQERVLWSDERFRLVAGLAGPDEELVLTEAAGTDALVALDAATGKERWRSPGDVQGAVRIDRRGNVYLRRGTSLVLLDGLSGKELATLEIGTGWKDFAFAGEGRIAIVRRVGVTRTELVVVGE